MNIDPIAQQVGKRLKMIRVEANLKQKDLAAELNITPPLLSMYEQGTREPSISFLFSYVNYFKLSLSQFFALIEEEPRDISPQVASLMDDFKKILANFEKKALKEG